MNINGNMIMISSRSYCWLLLFLLRKCCSNL